jgi:hypothetical protein
MQGRCLAGWQPTKCLRLLTSSAWLLSMQVAAAHGYWGATVVILPGVTHDLLLGPQAAGVAQQVLSWLQCIGRDAQEDTQLDTAARHQQQQANAAQQVGDLLQAD